MTREIPLTKGLVALVDDEDYPSVVQVGGWSASDCDGHWYARHSYSDQFGIRRIISLHTLLTGWILVDHRNGDGLDNRRANLRPATHSQNNANSRLASHNTSGFKGVTLYKRTGRYRAYLGTGLRSLHLGYFTTAEEAARAYDVAALTHFGEFARLNFPQEIAS